MEIYYKCYRCEKVFSQMSNIKNHFKRKIKCEWKNEILKLSDEETYNKSIIKMYKYSDKYNDEYIEQNKKKYENKENYKFQCTYCFKSYTQKQSLKVHAYSCKVKEANIKKADERKDPHKNISIKESEECLSLPDYSIYDEEELIETVKIQEPEECLSLPDYSVCDEKELIEIGKIKKPEEVKKTEEIKLEEPKLEELQSEEELFEMRSKLFFGFLDSSTIFINKIDIDDLSFDEKMKLFFHIMNKDIFDKIKDIDYKTILKTTGDIFKDEEITNEKMEGVYIIHTRECIRMGENVYKIGRTAQKYTKRALSYPKGSELKIQKGVKNSKMMEKKIIIELAKKFNRRTDLGNEYFEGDYNEIEKEFIKITNDV